jgi:hypothetical protein
MKQPKKQRKYNVFTAKKLKALLKMAEAQNGVIVLSMESAGHKFPGQLQLTDGCQSEVMEYWND